MSFVYIVVANSEIQNLWVQNFKYSIGVSFCIVLILTYNGEVMIIINERDIYASFNYSKEVMLPKINIVSSFMH